MSNPEELEDALIIYHLKHPPRVSELSDDYYPPYHTDWSETVLGCVLWILMIWGLVKFVMWVF